MREAIDWGEWDALDAAAREGEDSADCLRVDGAAAERLLTAGTRILTAAS